MINFLIRTLVFIVAAALGLLVADWILEGFVIDWADWWGFVLCVLIFAALQSILAPWVARMAKRNAPALLGGIGIISTLLALLIVVLLPIGGIRITDVLSWILAPVIVWIVTAIGALLLPLFLVKKAVNNAKS